MNNWSCPPVLFLLATSGVSREGPSLSTGLCPEMSMFPGLTLIGPSAGLYPVGQAPREQSSSRTVTCRIQGRCLSSELGMSGCAHRWGNRCRARCQIHLVTLGGSISHLIGARCTGKVALLLAVVTQQGHSAGGPVLALALPPNSPGSGLPPGAVPKAGRDGGG